MAHQRKERTGSSIPWEYQPAVYICICKETQPTSTTTLEASLGLTVGSVDATPTPEALSGLVEGLAEAIQHPTGGRPTGGCPTGDYPVRGHPIGHYPMEDYRLPHVTEGPTLIPIWVVWASAKLGSHIRDQAQGQLHVVFCDLAEL